MGQYYCHTGWKAPRSCKETMDWVRQGHTVRKLSSGLGVHLGFGGGAHDPATQSTMAENPWSSSQSARPAKLFCGSPSQNYLNLHFTKRANLVARNISSKYPQKSGKAARVFRDCSHEHPTVLKPGSMSQRKKTSPAGFYTPPPPPTHPNPHANRRWPILVLVEQAKANVENKCLHPCQIGLKENLAITINTCTYVQSTTVTGLSRFDGQPVNCWSTGWKQINTGNNRFSFRNSELIVKLVAAVWDAACAIQENLVLYCLSDIHP